jgi:hypothetical protein
MKAIFNTQSLLRSSSKVSRRRAQTTLEYFLMIAVFVIPVAIVLNSYLKDSGDNKKDNLVRNVVKSAYGDEEKMGVIGRPYP